MLNSKKTRLYALAGFFLFLVVGFQNFTNESGGKVQLDGELLVLHEDHRNNTSQTRIYLRGQSGKDLELKFKGKAPRLQSGSKVRVRGQLTSNTLELDSSGMDSGLQVLALPSASIFGEQKTAVLLVNFQSYPTQPFSVAAANDIVFNKTSSFFLENSSQQTWLSGQVFGWYTMPISFTCSTSQIASAAKQQAANAGVDLTPYSRFIYIFPTNGACSWSGVGTVGGVPSETWINGELTVKTIGHELGHNFGLSHSHSLDCGGTVLGSSCTSIEYGDASDIMGNLSTTHFNGFQKERLGWLAPARVITASSSGTYNLSPYESGGSGFVLLKIPKGVNATTGKMTWYYVEYRQPIGFDAQLLQLYNSNLTSGVQVRLGTDDNFDSSYLLDMTPNSAYADDTNDGVLLPGRSYEDSSAGVRIYVDGANSSGATVTLTLSQPCVANYPTVTMSPSQGSAVSAGSSVTYSVSVKNNNATSCGSSSFNLQAAMPAGLSASFSNPLLSLAAGASGSSSLVVTSTSSLAAGLYNFSVTANNGANSSYSQTVSASYSVAAALMASVSTDKASYAKGASVNITASISSGGSPVAGVSVSYAITKPNGSVVTGSAVTDSLGKALYKLRLGRKDPAGTYQVRINSSSGGNSISATTSFVVQ